jgi:hypothetical protein
VLGETPVVRQVVVDLRSLGDPFELPAEVGLPGVVGPVGEPHRQRRRPERSPEIDDLEVVLDRGLRARIDVGHDPNLYDVTPVAVVVGLSWKVLEFIASKPMPRRGVLAQRGGSGVVPRHVQRHGPVGTGQGVERGDVVDLLLGGARFASDREPTEAGSAGAERPGGRGHRNDRKGHIWAVAKDV